MVCQLQHRCLQSTRLPDASTGQNHDPSDETVVVSLMHACLINFLQCRVRTHPIVTRKQAKCSIINHPQAATTRIIVSITKVEWICCLQSLGVFGIDASCLLIRLPFASGEFTWRVWPNPQEAVAITRIAARRKHIEPAQDEKGITESVSQSLTYTQQQHARNFCKIYHSH